jgi:two-component system alkaline phosphatase synthesis response regulator PhoP|tara:strand:- start:1806 stop:2492 length:687 start_codon:yes stop_codon:yes gene_type:complete
MTKPNHNTILLVDDEKDILDLLKYNLEKEGFNVETASDGVEGLDKAKALRPSLILLDLMMPRMDGIETCGLIRQEASLNETIIVFLTSRSEDYSQVACLEAGADDFITKPIRPRVLIAKISALLRRTVRVENGNTVQSSAVVINRDKFIVEVKGERIFLPKKEFELLELLASKPGKVFTRDQIMSIVWGNDTIVGERTIDVHIRKLREKLGDEYIRTMKGVGYTFSEN